MKLIVNATGWYSVETKAVLKTIREIIKKTALILKNCRYTCPDVALQCVHVTHCIVVFNDLKEISLMI